MVTRSRILTWSVMAAMILGAGCSGKKPADQAAPPAAGPDSYEVTLLKERKEKDEFFRSNPQSPLRQDMRAAFLGLAYYPPNAGLRYRLKLVRHPLPQMIRIGTNTGEIRPGLRYGFFDFEVDGKACRLQVYRMDDSPAEGPPFLFIPFRDVTSGKETYPAGRYIELRENTSGVYDLDFNRAFNPYCAYNSSYSCPVPPEENRLAVPIAAGEKNHVHQ